MSRGPIKTAIAFIAEQSLVPITRKDFPADTLHEFIEFVKANAAKLSFGSGGAGASTLVFPLLADLVACVAGPGAFRSGWDFVSPDWARAEAALEREQGQAR